MLVSWKKDHACLRPTASANASTAPSRNESSTAAPTKTSPNSAQPSGPSSPPTTTTAASENSSSNPPSKPVLLSTPLSLELPGRSCPVPDQPSAVQVSGAIQANGVSAMSWTRSDTRTAAVCEAIEAANISPLPLAHSFTARSPRDKSAWVVRVPMNPLPQSGRDRNRSVNQRDRMRESATRRNRRSLRNARICRARDCRG